MKASNLAIAALSVVVSLTACKKETETPSNEQEEITTVEATLTGTDAGSVPVTFKFSDPDGPGGNNPTTQDTILLAAGKNYNAQIRVFDDTKSPREEVTSEIEQEKNEHQFFYTVTGGSLQVRYDSTDYDDNTPPKPVGLETKWRATAAGKGTVRVTLKHQPGQKAGIAGTEGDINIGETDVEVNFPYKAL